MTSLLQLETPRDTGLFAYISASRLNLWAKCPLAFRFRYVDEIKSPTNANLFLGKVVHTVLERYYRSHQIGFVPEIPDSQRFVADAWSETSETDSIDWAGPDDEQKYRTQAVALVGKYMDEYADKPERIVAMESQLQVPCIDPNTGEDLGIPLYGIVDLVLQENEKPIVVDFKTASAASSICEQAHSVQLTLYSLLLESNGYSGVETEIRQLVKTKTPKIGSYRFGVRTERHHARFFALVREYLDSLDRGLFNDRPCWSCGMCDYRGLCSAV